MKVLSHNEMAFALSCMEWGYLAHERGENIQEASEKFKRLYNNDRPITIVPNDSETEKEKEITP